MNYYNEWDRPTAAWLRELIKAKLIPPGEVDERSITDVRADDLRGFTQCHFKPATVFGEQVASADGREWLAGIRLDLEGLGYAVGGADLCAAGVGAPMVSQRLHWVAEADGSRFKEQRGAIPIQPPFQSIECVGGCIGMAPANGYHGFWWTGPLQVGRNCIAGEIERGGRKYRAKWRIKPGLSLLANGIPGRVVQLRGFGNAINPWVAKEFIEAFIECV